MPIPQLYPEIWAHIASYLELPKPRLQAIEWENLHQNDLASLMRVSKIHFEVTAPLLYREPIIENVWSFLQASDFDTSAPYEGREYRWPMPLPVPEAPDHPTIHQKLGVDETTKSFCSKYVQKLNIILLNRTFSFSYFTIFFIEVANGRKDLWENLIYLENPMSVDRLQIAGRVTACNLSASWIHHLYSKLLPSWSCNSHRSLRPKSVTFGAYGDWMWNIRARELTRDLTISGRKDFLRLMKEVNSVMSHASTLVKQLWTGYPHSPVVQCTRFEGGPYGTHDNLLQQWEDHDKAPRRNIYHCSVIGYDYAITIGAENIIIFDPNNVQPIGKNDWTQRMIDIDQHVHDVFKEGMITQKHIDDTIVHMYGPKLPDCIERKSKNPYKYFQKLMDNDELMGPLKGKFRIYPYSMTPSCPACGWSKGMRASWWRKDFWPPKKGENKKGSGSEKAAHMEEVCDWIMAQMLQERYAK